MTAGAETEVVAGIRGVDVPDPEGHRFLSYEAPDRPRWYFTAPPPGVYDVIFWARHAGEERYNDRIAQFRIVSRNEADGLLPPGVLRFSRRYYEQGVRLTEFTTDSAGGNRDRRVRFEIEYPPDVRITSAILDETGASRDPETGERYTREYRTVERPREGTVVLSFAAPAGDQAWRVRVFGQKAGQEQSWTLLELRLPGSGG